MAYELYTAPVFLKVMHSDQLAAPLLNRSNKNANKAVGLHCQAPYQRVRSLKALTPDEIEVTI